MLKLDSIIQQDKECYICGTTQGLHSHHIFFGKNRTKSEQYGLKVWLCGYHHNLGGKWCVHQNHELDLQIKREAQAVFERKYGKELFLREFGKDYEKRR